MPSAPAETPSPAPTPSAPAETPAPTPSAPAETPDAPDGSVGLPEGQINELLRKYWTVQYDLMFGKEYSRNILYS